MQSGRDSSLWRSLAVAFGDGLAFGVGMKLTSSQRAAAEAPAEAPEVAGRIEELERRLAQVERARVAAPAVDQKKLLEAVVHAVEARLREQADQVDRRLAQVDQKVLEAVVSAVEGRLGEQAEQVEQRLADVESKFVEALKALREQDQAVASFVKDNLEELQEQFSGQIAAIRRDVAAMAGQNRDRELLDLLNGVGDLVRQAAARISESAVKPEPAAEPNPEPAGPTFGSTGRPRGLWRVPIVSSMAIGAGALALLHYL